MQDRKNVILYCDDDQDFLDSMRMVLEANDYVMLEANSAEQGLKVYKASSPDLLIVDLMMEEIDAGINFVKELKALGATAPIYMLSSVGDNLNAEASYSDLGLAGVFQKPVNSEALLKVLAAKLG